MPARSRRTGRSQGCARAGGIPSGSQHPAREEAVAIAAAYGPFLSAVSAASAALIGLLFVAVTVDPERVRHQAQADRQMNAGMAFFAFVDTLFVALSGLLPGAGAAGTSRILGVVGVLAAMVVLRAAVLRRGAGAPSRVSLPLLALTAAVYAAQVATSQVLLQSPSRAWAENDLCATLMVLLVIGIMRSWELLGMGRGGLASLYGRTEDAPAPEAEDVAEEAGS